MAEPTNKMTTFRRTLVIVSGGFFLVSMSSGLFSMFSNDGQTQSQEATAQTTSANQQLEQQALGYEKVLTKEPQNKFALDGLIKARLDMNDIKGLQTQIERLMKIYPNEPAFQEVMKAIEKDLKANGVKPETPAQK
jgi:hypothetical protein